MSNQPPIKDLDSYVELGTVDTVGIESMEWAIMILIIVFLIVANILTLWALKTHRVRHIQASGLALIYGKFFS